MTLAMSAKGKATAAATSPGKMAQRRSPRPSAIERPIDRTSHPATLATVPPICEGLPARLTDGVESGARSAPHAVQYGTTPR